ncbi:MAG: phosphatase PAP2 family protein [Verrucomicrobia bacterium]|nr:phosphatase PAP2 family protein [Verrucomicrobiota bacterium]
MDQKLLFLINREWTGPVLDRVMTAVSSSALWKWPFVALLIAVLVRGGFRARAFVLVAGFAVLLCDSVAGYGIKRAVGRLRPHESEFGVRQLSLAYPPWRGIFQPVHEEISLGLGTESAGRSFPSNHSANTACVALLAAIFFRRFGWLAFFPALIVAYSRVYTGSHWPSDVLGGIVFGLGVAVLALLLAELLWRRFAPRLSPALAARRPSLLGDGSI